MEEERMKINDTVRSICVGQGDLVASPNSP